MKAQKTQRTDRAPGGHTQKSKKAEIKELEDRLLREAPFDNWAIRQGSRAAGNTSPEERRQAARQARTRK